jgi:hypothetical protein
MSDTARRLEVYVPISSLIRQVQRLSYFLSYLSSCSHITLFLPKNTKILTPLNPRLVGPTQKMGSKRPRIPDLTATPPRLSPFLHESIQPGRPEAGLWSSALPSVPEEEEATDRSGDQGSLGSVGATSASGITPESQSRERPAKKRRIECTGCKKGPISANKSLYRHQRTCKDYCAQFNTSPESHPCGECGEICSRLDILQRHVQNTHQGQPRRRPQGSGNVTQRISSDTAPEPQGTEPQPQVMNTTTPGLWKDSSLMFTLQDSATCYTGAVSCSDTNDIIASALATYEHHAQIYSQAFMTTAAEPNLQSSGYITVSSEDDRTPDRNSISQEGTSVSAPSNDLTPATSNSSTVSSAHEVAAKPDGDTDDDAELAALADRSLNFSDVPYASANPVSQGRNLRPNRIRFPTPCPLCGDELGNGPNDNGEVKMHLERHKSRMEAITYNTVDDSEAVCIYCQIHFLDIRDLRRHLESVRTGQGCGFEFDHCGANCSGHHPRNFRAHEIRIHLRFEEALRRWEDFQRRAFEEYFNAYMEGTARTNAPPHGEIPRRRAFAENLEAYLKGLPPNDGQPACHRSTGSIHSVKSAGSILSAMSKRSTPVPFRYGGDATPKIILDIRNSPRMLTDLAGFFREPDAIRVFAEAVAKKKFKFEAYMWGMDASWFRPDPKVERVRCLHLMVEQGLNVSAPSVKHLVAALEGPAFEALMFAENRPLTVQSRLTQHAFFYGISQGRISLVAKLLKHGILDSASGMPNVDFCRELQKSCPRFNGPPPNESVAYIYNSMELGTCALNLALNMRQYRVASLLLEHGVQPDWGIDYLATSRSTMQHLGDEIYIHFRLNCLTPLPDYLGLLERRLLAPAIMLA